MIDVRSIHEGHNFFLIAGPCAIESETMALRIAETMVNITDRLDIPYIFKGSYRKANRSSVNSFTGIGDEQALEVLAKVRSTFDVPVTTDFHTEAEATMAATYVDVLQVPAFLCRQTSLLQAAAATGKVVNIKKGQFMGAEPMHYAVQKVQDAGQDTVWLTERGTTFGYQDLVVDYRSIPRMQQTSQVPVVMDCTHSLQRPNQSTGVTGGDPTMIGTIAKAAIAVGADGLFIETHPDCASAKSDGANMLPLDQIGALLQRLVKIREAVTD